MAVLDRLRELALTLLEESQERVRQGADPHLELQNVQQAIIAGFGKLSPDEQVQAIYETARFHLEKLANMG